MSFFCTPLRRIAVDKGDVLHAMKATDPGFTGFGEAYFTTIGKGRIKGWKRHRAMTLNLVCVAGVVRFVMHQGAGTPAGIVILSPRSAETYARLTVPPLIWVAFEGLGEDLSLVLNIADRPHDPAEADTADLPAFAWPERPV